MDTSTIFDTNVGFVNTCLNILYTKIPSYCYFTNDCELHHFYDNLKHEEKKIIYKYLVNNLYINDYIINEEMFINNFRNIIDNMINIVTNDNY